MYTEAAQSLLEEGVKTSEVLKNLKKVLERRGHEKLYLRVLKNLARNTERGVGTETIVRVAKEAHVKKFKNEIKNASARLGVKESDTRTFVDESLIGGYTVETKDVLLDQSYKSALLNIYRKVIS